VIRISKATREDLPAIRHLSSKYGHKLVVEDHHLNNRDLALQARNEEGKLVGFVWAGLMANSKIAYVDKVMVDPEYSGKRLVLPSLYKKLLELAIKRGVRDMFGFIRQDQYHDRSAIAALHMAVGGEEIPYTHVFAQLKHMELELKNLGVI
jgi:N-acetylglutamate synthase-like GNAT family acetyltransferase